MSNQYLLHLPDGTEYGPVDRATLEAWSREGRLPAETLVWPEGAPEWISLEKALALPAAAPPAAPPASSTPGPPPSPAAASARPVSTRPTSAPPPEGDRPDTRPPMHAPAFDGRRPRGRAAAGGLLAAWRPLVMTLVGVIVVFAFLAGLWAVLRPFVAKRRAIAAVQRHALADRRVEDPRRAS